MTTIDLQQVADKYFTTPTITRSSARQYHMNLLRWLRFTGETDMESIMADPVKNLKLADDKYTSGELSHASKKLMIATVCALYKHHPEYESKFAAQRQLWSDALKASNKKEFETVAYLEPSQKQLLNWVQWDEVVKKEQYLRATEYASDDHLLVAMYSLIEPARADYGELHIVVDDKRARQLNKNMKNYIFLTSVPGKSYLVLNEYKTVKSFGRYWRYIPDDLVRIIAANLERKPRDYLFVNRFLKPHGRISFRHLCNDTYRRLFGKSVTVSMIRHSYISNIDFNTTTPARLFEISRHMMHSVQMQQLYRRAVTVPPVNVSLEGDASPAPAPVPTVSMTPVPAVAATVVSAEDAEKEARRLQKKKEKRKRRKMERKMRKRLQESAEFAVPSDRIVTI